MTATSRTVVVRALCRATGRPLVSVLDSIRAEGCSVLRCSRILATSLVAGLFLVVLGGTALASRFEITPSPLFRAEWTASRVLWTSAGVSCNMTLEGSFHDFTIAKARDRLVGLITRAVMAHPCLGGEGWFLNGNERIQLTLPWHLRYDSFEGNLPEIRGVRLRIVGLRILTRESLFGNECLWESTEASPLLVRLTREIFGRVTNMRTVTGSRAVLSATLRGTCPATTEWNEQSSNFWVLGTTRVIILRLI